MSLTGHALALLVGVYGCSAEKPVVRGVPCKVSCA